MREDPSLTAAPRRRRTRGGGVPGRRRWYGLRRGAPVVAGELLEPAPPPDASLVPVHSALETSHAAVSAELDGPYADLAAPLERLDRILARAVDRVSAAYGVEAAGDPFRGLYISHRDAAQWSQSPRVAPAFGAADGESELLDLIEAGSPLGRLARAYELTSFDLDLIVVALAPEIDLRYGRIYAFLQDDVSRRSPSIDLAFNLLCPTAEAKLSRRDHLATDAPLVRYDLIELVPDQSSPLPSLPAHFLRLDDAVARYLLRQRGIDARLRHVGQLVEPGEGGAGSLLQGDEQRALEAMVAEAHATGEALVLYVSGPETGSKRAAAQALAARAGAPLLALDVGSVIASDLDSGRLLKIAFREAMLQSAVLFLEPLDVLRASERQAEYRRLVDELGERRGVTILAGTLPAPPRDGLRGVVHVPLPIPAYAERRRLWSDRLVLAGIELQPRDVEQLAGRFRLTADQIADAVEVGRNRARLRPAAGSGWGAEQPSLAELFEAARTRSDAALSGLARKIDPVHGWAQIILPDDSIAQLREICDQVVQRHRVLDEWGFGRTLSLGKGVSALFAGPSGTGKTMAADIIARELGLDLYKIDLSAVVSKYIGETEKNLERIFTAAENANSILFFDEADALFGKRSEVRDSHDRYANLEIAYLLQRMEQYEGVAILATNLRQNMDDAFVRRLQFVVEFPFPDEEQRARIWPLLFPVEAECEADIDFAALARCFRVTGGSIKNIVLGAAFLAATETRPIGTRHILHATRREYLKLGRVLTEGELGPFASLVRT